MTFNGIAATPTSWSATSIAAPVPSGATTGNVVVTVGGVASAGKAFTVAPAITGLSPSSGAVGTVVTINGTSFGSPQGSSTVKFNGTIATPTSWSTTSIIVPVPTGATTGAVVVTVGGVVSTGVTFTVLATPSITSLSPTSGVQGISVTITGANFGSTQGVSTVKFNGTTGTPTSWSATSIKVPVPAGATTGNVVVHASGVDSNGSTFTVLPTPSITSLAPTSGMVGDSVTITGTNFGATQGASTVKFNGTAAAPTSWSDTGIVTPVPTGATTGNVVVTVSGVASTGVSFTVVAIPTITSLSPTSGAVGTLVTINGTNFQPTQGTSTLTFNGTPATPTSWSATQIKALVPSGATSGAVVATVFGSDSNGASFSVKPTPVISALSQTVGSVGMVITISGVNFGTTQGSSTVKFNGAAATPSSWGATQIAVPVPSTATTGSVVVHTSGVDTNGINFTVATVTSLAVTPQNLTVPVNSAQRFIANATYSNGSVQALAANNAVWSSSSTPIATVDTGGLATTVAQGQTTIQAAVGAINSSSTLTVKGPSFVPVGSLNTARWRHTATLLPDGRVLIVGGGTDHNTLASAELYDPVSKTFSFTGGLNTPRQSHTATLLQNGKVLISGGGYYVNDIGPYSPNYDELYDPATSAFTPVGTAASVIGGPATLLLNGKVLFSDYPGMLYDPASGTFTTKTNLEPLGIHSAALLSAGTVLVVGGGTDTPSAMDSVNAQTYDPQTDTFSLTGSFDISTTYHSLTRLNNGKVLLAGGVNNAAGVLARTELYDPAVGTFSKSANLALARTFHTAVPLTDGTALLVGGSTGSSLTGTAELFDPSSQTFVGAGSLATPRSDHTETLLNDGTVLIVGGSSGTLLASAELYAPPQPPPVSLQISPATTNLVLGQTQQFKAVDELGHLRFDATWTISDPSLAPITPGNLPTLTAAAAGQVTLTANVQGVTAQLHITIAPSSLQVTPAAVNLQVGDSRQFNVVDNLSHPSGDVIWTVSDTNLASVTNDNQTTLTALNPGQVTLTATVEGVSAHAQVTIQAVGVLAPGTILWSNPSAPGFAPLQIAQAVPTNNGPDVYSIQVSNDGTQSVVQALTADGLQKWQTPLPIVNGNSVPDGSGGLVVTEHNTCLPNQTDPMTIVDLDAITGQPKWQFAAAGVQNGNQVLYCYPDTVKALEPQFAVRGDGTVVIAAMTNNGLPPLMLVSANGQPASLYIPTSNGTHPDGTPFADFSPEGPPIIDSDGSAYMEYEVRYVTYPPKVLQAVLYLLKIAPDGSRSDITLNSTTDDENLMPGRIIPDGQGGVLATWTISPSNPPIPTHPYQASHVVGGAAGTPYDLPFSPNTITVGSYPTLVLGENSTAFASGLSSANDGSSNDVDKIASFDLNSGTSNWSYQASTQAALSIVEATSGGGLTVNDTDPGIIHFDTNGNPSATIPFLQGARPFDFGSWLSSSNGAVSFLWSPNGTNGIPTTLAQSVFPTARGNAQGQNQPPFCQRKNSNCVLAPHSDQTAPNPFFPVQQRTVEYDVFSLQSGNLVPMAGTSQIQRTRIAGLETNPTNPNGFICDWKTVETQCHNDQGTYTDKYTVGSSGVNTVKQQFFVDRAQVQVFWPTDGFNGQGFAIKTWYGAWDQNATTDASKGAIIQQNNPNMQNGATCTLSPPDPQGCSPLQADGTN